MSTKKYEQDQKLKQVIDEEVWTSVRTCVTKKPRDLQVYKGVKMRMYKCQDTMEYEES